MYHRHRGRSKADSFPPRAPAGESQITAERVNDCDGGERSGAGA